MSTTATASPQSARISRFFELMQQAMSMSPEYTKRVNAHVLATSGHVNVVAYLRNGAPDEDKVQMLTHCLAAWRKSDNGKDTSFPTLQVTEPQQSPGPRFDPGEQEEERPEEQDETDEEDEEGDDDDEAAVVSNVIEEVEEEQSEAIQKALKLLGRAIAQPKKVKLDESRVVELLKRDGPGLLKNDILNWLKIPLAEIDTRLTESMGKFNRSELESVIVTALQSAVGQKIVAGLQSGELEILPPILPVDPTYVRNDVSLQLERAIQKNHHVIISGPSGSGKTFPAEQELRRAGKRYIDYMEANPECDIFEKHGVSDAMALKIRGFLEKARDLYKKGVITFAPSTRTGKEIAKEVADGIDFTKAVRYCVADGLPPEDAKKILDCI